MSKFSKKSLAVLTTAAIMASTASVIASAAVSATIPSGLTVYMDQGSGKVPFDEGEVGRNDVITWDVPKGKIVKLTVNGTEVTDTSYTIASNTDVLVFTLENDPNAGGSSEPTPAGDENFDSVVWVNGKDTKASKDGKTPASLYKTEQYDQVMMSAGGKWQVAVTETTVDETAFVALVKDGKFDSAKAKAMKDYASAKVKDGKVTVTAGKKAGNVTVWVYEVKEKSIVASAVEGNAFYEKLDDEVMPKPREFEVKVAPSLTYTAAKADGTGATTVDAEKNTVKAVDKPEKLAKGYDAGKDVTVYLCDKKNDISLDATYVLWDGQKKKAAELNEEGKLVVDNSYTAELITAENGAPAVKITIDAKATEKTKIDVQVKNVESGKIAKIAPKVNKPAAADKTEEFTLTVGDGVKVLVDGTEKTLTDGKVKLAKGTKVTFDVDVTIGDKDVTTGTEYEVTADATVAKKA